MLNLWIAGLSGALLAAGMPPAEALPEITDTIIVRLRAPYGICAGACPDYVLTIHPSGKVHTAPHPDSHFERGREYAFSASREQLRAAHNILNRIRPSGVRRVDVACSVARLPDGSPDPLDDPRPDDLHISWIGLDRIDSLSSCARYSRVIWKSLWQAVAALGADIAIGVPSDLIFGKERPDD